MTDLPPHPDDDRMREEVKDDSLYPPPEIKREARIHPWVYTIIPITTTDARQWVLFTAYCKACRSYFSERIPYAINGKGQLTKSSLPRYGCEPISEDVNLL